MDEPYDGVDYPIMKLNKKHAISRITSVLLLGVLALGGTLGSVAAAPPPDKPRHVIVGTSPFADKDARNAGLRACLLLIIKGLEPGEELEVYDAYNIRRVAEIAIPDKAAYRNEKIRVREFGPEIAKLRSYFASTTEASAPVKEAIKVPNFVRYLTNNVLVDDGRATELILLGNPIFADNNEPDFNFTDGYFPNDYHLKVSGGHSIFGCAGKEKALDGVRIHFGFDSDTAKYDSSIHESRVSRFWGVWFSSGLGGKLVTYSEERGDPFRRISIAELPAIANEKPDFTDGGLHMMKFERTKEVVEPKPGTPKVKGGGDEGSLGSKATLSSNGSGVTDIVFVLDATFSMNRCLDGVKEGIGDFVAELDRTARLNGADATDFRIKLVAYRDIHHDADWLEETPFSADVSEFRSALSRIEAAGGHDAPESLLDAIEHLNNLGSSEPGEDSPVRWRNEDESHRVVVIYSDAPYHAKTLSGAGIEVFEKLGAEFHLFTPKTAPYLTIDRLKGTELIDYRSISKSETTFAESLEKLAGEIGEEVAVEVFSRRIGTTATTRSLPVGSIR